MADAGHKRKGRRHKTHEQFVEEMSVRNPKVEVIGLYVGSQRPVEVRCRRCGHVWEPVASSVLYGSGCPECKRHKISAVRHKTHEQFMVDLTARNPKVEVIGRYEGAQRPVEVRCRRCGHVWEPVANTILQGTGCPECKRRKLSVSRHKTHEQFVSELAERNPRVEVVGRYEGALRRVKVRCRRCGHVWEPIANNILQGSGCPKCRRRKPKKSHEQFVEEVASKNPKVEVIGRYEGSKVRIQVRCRECGHVWEPRANRVLQGYGCPECAHRKASGD